MYRLLTATLLLLPFLLMDVHAATLPLETADISSMTSGWETPKKDLAVTGKPVRIGGRYQGGIYRNVSLLVTAKLHITDAVHPADSLLGIREITLYPSP